MVTSKASGPDGSAGKESSWNAGDTGDADWIFGLRRSPAVQETQGCEWDPWVGKISWSRKWLPTPIFLPEKSYGQRRPVGYSPKGCRVRHN